MYFLGIDVSTTATKALLVNERGEVAAVSSHPYTLQTPKPLWSEQDPREWWGAVTASIQSVLKKARIGGDAVSAVGLTGQMHGLVRLDEGGNVLRPAILWDEAQMNTYRAVYQLYREHYRALKPSFNKMAQLSS